MAAAAVAADKEALWKERQALLRELVFGAGFGSQLNASTVHWLAW